MAAEPFVTMELDGIAFELLEPHDFSWLRRFGRVFRVFDQQDSGNICFGVRSGSTRLFIKYAGARTVDYDGTTADTVARLRLAVPLYESLKHPLLIELLDHHPVNGGYMAVFEWFDGEGLHSLEYPGRAKYDDPRSPYRRFRELPVEYRLRCLDQLYRFHVFVGEQGYVAVDFYDGSIMYDFEHHSVRICDIDFYTRKPCINEVGRMWGSSRFMSPEEFELGAAIDGVTNVFGMGATAFALVGGMRDRSRSKWEASDALYQVALNAVEPRREDRYASVADLLSAWMEARRQEA